MQFLARVYVTLKPTVNDPQGITVKSGLHTLGFAGVTGVRVGKYLEVQIEAASQDEAARRVQEMCKQLLANPVIEQFRFDLELVAGQAPVAPRRKGG
jgi:phosphoribosylformylglycinamidine synthase